MKAKIKFCYVDGVLTPFYVNTFVILIFAFLGKIDALGAQKAPLTTPREWIRKSVETHNFFRSLHGSPPLILNETLSEVSQFYANYLLQRTLQNWDNGICDGRVYFEHSPEARQAKMGENLYFSKNTLPVNPIPSSYAVLLWYEEIKDYDFPAGTRKPTSNSTAMIGHLTQLLWKATTQMGTAYASHKCRNGQTLVFVVANYYEQGNIRVYGDPTKLYLENVLPPSKSEAEINAQLTSMNVNSWFSEFDEAKLETSSSWRTVALTAHNYYRGLHGAQEIRLNFDVCKVSQIWAESLLKEGLGSFNFNGVLHQIQTHYMAVGICNMGEISMVFISQDEKPSAEFIVKSWYAQKDAYNFEKNAPKDLYSRTENFEQVVWNSSTEFCISYATKQTSSGQYLTYVVANYYPARSSKVAERRLNVFPANSEPEVDIRFEDDDMCSTVPTTILIILVVVIMGIAALIGALLLLRKYQVAWYHSVMKFLRLKKY